jgi:hypothetical protein
MWAIERQGYRLRCIVYAALLKTLCLIHCGLKPCKSDCGGPTGFGERPVGGQLDELVLGVRAAAHLDAFRESMALYPALNHRSISSASPTRGIAEFASHIRRMCRCLSAGSFTDAYFMWQFLRDASCRQ